MFVMGNMSEKKIFNAKWRKKALKRWKLFPYVLKCLFNSFNVEVMQFKVCGVSFLRILGILLGILRTLWRILKTLWRILRTLWRVLETLLRVLGILFRNSPKKFHLLHLKCKKFKISAIVVKSISKTSILNFPAAKVNQFQTNILNFRINLKGRKILFYLQVNLTELPSGAMISCEVSSFIKSGGMTTSK